ncbi:hypothetical protein [Xanthomonas arboricola]|uniref:hypothetical protein n=1 Tax=Xanthomonas arboricola TaxID=56448 RepID=UPI00063E71C5|nr:hypothetical protein [Xanthomonas arboricola]MBB3849532.1 hypothetical protein [Xanthomonas arboricola]PPT21976.1 hypothetical protein XarbCFBP7629_10635 [Xanthomonas arboricola]
MRRDLIVLVVLGIGACLPGCAVLQDMLHGPRPGPNGFVTVSCTNTLPNPSQPCEEQALRACSDTAIRQFVTAHSSPNMVTIYPSRQKSKDDGKNKDRASAEYQCYLTKPQPWDSGYTPPAR